MKQHLCVFFRLRLIFITIALFAFIGFSPIAFAWTYYQYGHHPADILALGNSYKEGNPYGPIRNQNPYRPFWNPYNKNSVYHNHDKYSAQIHSSYGNFQGQASHDIGNPKSITNPYGKYGNHYRESYVDHPYRSNNANNPYSQFQNPYDPRSVRNNPKFGEQYFDSHGDHLGHSQSHTYPNTSVQNPYFHNPYVPSHTTNPYGENKHK